MRRALLVSAAALGLLAGYAWQLTREIERGIAKIRLDSDDDEPLRDFNPNGDWVEAKRPGTTMDELLEQAFRKAIEDIEAEVERWKRL